MSSAARKSSYIFENRITFLGAGKVGKTAIIDQITKRTFTEEYEQTVQNHLNHVIEDAGEIFICLIVDTCGEDDFPVMRQLAINKGNAFVIVYCINDLKTFKRAKAQIDEIKNLKANSDEDVKIVLVGNKMDLEDEREVSWEDGAQCAREANSGNVNATFMESSAKEYWSVVKILPTLSPHAAPAQDTQNNRETKDRRVSLSKIRRRKTSKALIMKKQLTLEVSQTSPSHEYRAFSSDSEVDRRSNLSPRPVSPSLSPSFPGKFKLFRSRSSSTGVNPDAAYNSPDLGSLKRGETRSSSSRIPWLRSRSQSLSHVSNLEISNPSLLSTSAKHRFESSTSIEEYRNGQRRPSDSSRLSTDDEDHDSGVSDGMPSPIPSPHLHDLRKQFKRQNSLLGNMSGSCKEKLQTVTDFFRKDGRKSKQCY